MGFGPTTNDPQKGVQAILDLVELLYPERSTASCQTWLGHISLAVLSAHAPLSFVTIDRFLKDAEYRSMILSHPAVPEALAELWKDFSGPLDASQLDPDLAWLINDRLSTLHDEEDH
ncbi:MAG: hypothetical protein C7B44_13010 [Sulfobacillus thermosulfidooxidans]|uniref:hypothetical protein n=1 Tax=Sulfobacillus TaxID=28033 RepID=UPI000CD2CA9E|nr:hypothetical protein [Sulfobacillus sp. hq2]POB10360.1 hypothetical protein CO251_10450 [Sulfobacillus sp. hq2]PSR35667.1 MAG: hypothetical protein C7B44_13010 [Sulfobacillus thermosulfidooxidans]